MQLEVSEEMISLENNVHSHANRGRRMMSRQSARAIDIVDQIRPGQQIDGCLVCCAAPACCPLFSACPCFGDAEYIRALRKASTYVYIRENSIEWNEPSLILKQGTCFGVDPCAYDIQDNVTVLYFDDVMFESITDQTRTCNECLTCLFGGRGERIRMDSPACCGCCQRASFPCLCAPTCCPSSIFPCLLRHEIYVEDAQKGLYEVKKARRKALDSEFYSKDQGENMNR